jgi:SAM-dependent methyltransferase
LIYLNLKKKENNTILDVGCGSGLLAIASEPFLGQQGQYIGIDVSQQDIRFCREHYPVPRFSFIHHDNHHPIYAPFQKYTRSQWNLESESLDLLLALSVWTHLSEKDALFYIREVNRVLKPGARAIITLFVLDEWYEMNLAHSAGHKSRFHRTEAKQWIFDQPAYGSDAWFRPRWATIPESAIAITKPGLERLLSNGSLVCLEHYPGTWKEYPGIYFQDILVLQKGL